MKNYTIIGAGLVGSLLAIYLAKRGHKVTIFERRPDMRKEKTSVGRSINLALSDRGWRGLEGVGIVEDVKRVALPMKGRMIHNLKGEQNFQPYGKEDQAINSVSRGGLNVLLMDLAEKNNVEIKFNHRCTHLDLNNGTAGFFIDDENKEITHISDLIFGADGAYSAVRLQMQLSTDRFNYNQYYIEHGYKELTIPAGENGKWLLDNNALHIWPRGKFMLIALPNQDGSFTCTLFFPFEGDPSFNSLKTKEQVKNFFEETFTDAVKLMPDLIDEYFSNPTASLVTVKCFPWSYKENALLIGDAAHAIVPFFGQGMNCGFEDCTVLNQLMDKFDEDWSKILPEFERSRKPDADAIADLAIENFIEMRDKVADPKFLLQKKIEAKFNNKFPEKWTPLYTMVTFTHEPYSAALAQGRKHDRIMHEIMAQPNIFEEWDQPWVENKMLELLEKN
ncbi:MAG: FAD-dependent oxidoreductase [Bacteroidia bacterium]